MVLKAKVDMGHVPKTGSSDGSDGSLEDTSLDFDNFACLATSLLASALSLRGDALTPNFARSL